MNQIYHWMPHGGTIRLEIIAGETKHIRCSVGTCEGKHFAMANDGRSMGPFLKKDGFCTLGEAMNWCEKQIEEGNL